MLHLEVVKSFAQAKAPVLVFDFDGTVSPIVDDPLEARLVADLEWMLTDLVDRGAKVALISSRPVHFLADTLPSDLSFMTLIGYNGLEVLTGDNFDRHLISDEYRRTISEACDEARHISVIHPEILVEDSHLSFTLHYRLNYKLYQTAKDAAFALAARHKLLVSEGRMAFQVSPDTGMNKGLAVSNLISSLAAADWILYAGDSTEDLAAFNFLDSAAGPEAVKVAVDSSETSRALREEADLVLNSPSALRSLVNDLLSAPVGDRRPDEVDLRSVQG